MTPEETGAEMETLRIGVAIVSYNTRDLLHAALQSVGQAAARVPHAHVTTVVVDNASRDGSAAMVARDFPQVDLFAASTNLGFTGGNNWALRRLGFPVAAPAAVTPPAPMAGAPPEFVLLLNPDAELTPTALAELVTVMQQRPHAAVCGAHLRYGDGSFQHGAFRFPNLFQVALDLFPLAGLPGAQRVYASRLNGRYAQEHWEGREAFPVDFVLGATMLVRGKAIAAVGGLDDGYFMYCEEMDWCLRMAKLGWETVVAPTARVIHHEGQSSRQVRWQSQVRLWRSRFRFYAKHTDHYPPAYRRLLALLIRAGLWNQSRLARRDFARGRISGSDAAAALDAYAQVGDLLGALHGRGPTAAAP